MADLDSMHARFAELFEGARPEVQVRSPGRLNLLGDHTDYNDGFMLPIATTQAMHILARRRDDRQMIARTTAFDEAMAANLDYLGHPGEPAWANYIKGVAAMLQNEGIDLVGCDLLIDSEVPVGGGVGSSAALEVGTAYALLGLIDAHYDPVQLALLCRQAEHTWAENPCGIMDQFICVLGHPGHALLLDCRSQDYDPIPVNLPGTAFVVMDTQVKHESGASEQSVRRRQCQEALKHIQAKQPEIPSLRDVTPEVLETVAGGMDAGLVKRCCHVVTEIERTVRGAEALKQGDAEAFGRLMLESHASLRDDYEVSCTELDALVAVASSVEGVYGARMTGTGFGGCAIALVEADALEPLAEALRERYSSGHEKPALAYTTQPSGGASWKRL